MIELYAGHVKVRRDGSTVSIRAYENAGQVFVWDGAWQVPGRYDLEPHLESYHACVCGLVFTSQYSARIHRVDCPSYEAHLREAEALSIHGDALRPTLHHPDWSALRAQGFRWPW